MNCDRCGKEMRAHTMSMFNTDLICLTCKAAERQHPKYAEAVAADEAACQAGEYNYPGIGLPADLVWLGAPRT